MEIFKRELIANRKSLLIWGICLAALSLLMVGIFPSFATDAARLDSLLELYPEAFLKVFGLDQLSMADPIGFYATEAYFMIVLFGSIFAAIVGSTILSKEEDERTIEFLLARPVSRTRMLTNKLLAFTALLFLLNLGIGVLTYLAFIFFDVGEFSIATLMHLLITPFFAHFAFASISFFLSLFFARKKTAYSAGIGLVISLYFVNVLATLSERLEILRYLTPYYYTDAVDIVLGGRLNVARLAVLLVASGVAVAATYYLYRRRDISI